MNVRRVLWSLAGLALALSPVGCDTKSDISVGMTLSADPVTQGVVDIRFSLDGAISADSAQLKVDGATVAELKQLDMAYRLPVTQYTDGAHTLSLDVVIDGEQARTSQSFTVRNPKGWVVAYAAPEVAYPGGTVRIDLTTGGTVSAVRADFSGIDPSGALTATQGYSLGATSWVIEYTLSNAAATVPAEWYDIPIEVVDNEDNAMRFTEVRLFRSDGEIQPLQSEYGVVEYAPFPEGGNAAAAVRATAVGGTLSVISGGTFVLDLAYEGDPSGAQALIGLDDHGGYLVVSLDVVRQVAAQSARGTPIAPAYATPLRPGAPRPAAVAENHILIPVNLPEGTLPDGTRETWAMKVAIRDAAGRINDIQDADLSVAEAESGTLRVTLSWDTATDVDLHVIEPGGTEIYYGNRSSPTGGALDLDSNAGCGIDGVKQENIYWDLPANGTYTIGVDFWSDCPDDEGNGLPANWRVVVSGCGIEEETTGSFSAGTSDGGSTGFTELALTVDAQCQPNRVSGIVQYVRSSPVARASQKKDLVGAKIQVIDEDENVLGEGVIGTGGHYKVLYDQPEEGPDAEVSLQILAENSLNKIEELDGSKVHTFADAVAHTWAPSDEETGEHERNILIEDETEAGAMHLFMLSRKAVQWYAAKGYATTEAATTRWTLGQKPSFCASCYVIGEKIIYLTGTVADPDHFDDPVYLHEFGHRMHYAYGRSDSPNGEHSLYDRAVPTLAFAEGLVTYLGQRVYGSSIYYDSGARGVSITDLNSLSPGMPTDTSTGFSTGNLSEAVVMGAMWDMYDAVNASEKDFVSGWDDALLRSAFESMDDTANLDKGTRGQADFADTVWLLACNNGVEVKTAFDNMLSGKYDLPWLQERNFCTQ